MGFWDSPYPGQPVDPGMPSGYQPPPDPLTAALLAQKGSAYVPPGAELPMSGMGTTPDQQAAAASIFHRFVDPFVQVATLPGRVLEGQQVDPTTEGLNFAGAVTMPSLGRAALAGSVPRDLLSMSGAADKPGIIAYHGSPHDFDAFDISKIGTGEGAQVYGHGLYFAENEGTAKNYRDALGKKVFSSEISPDVIADYEKANGPLPPNWQSTTLAQQLLQETHARDPIAAGKGRMYQVQINADPSHFLDWDKPLSEQSTKVQEALKGFGIEPHTGQDLGTFAGNAVTGAPMSGAEAYHRLGRNSDMIPNSNFSFAPFTPDVAGAAAKLRDAGIPGIKYLDAGSRDKGAGSHNYVTFSDDIINILKKYGLAGLGLAGYGASQNQGAPQGQ